MKCSCPKCRAEIELTVADVTAAGTPAKCPLCNARMVVHRESFGARIFRRSGEISCANCGEILGPEVYCASCSTKYPDYLVVTLGRKPSGRAAGVKLKTSPFPRLQAPKGKAPRIESTAPRDAKPLPHPAPKKETIPQKALLLVLVVALAIAVLSGGAFFFLHRKSNEEYTKNYVRAAYCILSGVEKGSKANARVAAEYKAKAEAGQSASLKVGPDEEKDLRGIKVQVDNLMQQLNNPPKNFATAGDKLARLYTLYLRMNAAVLDPPQSGAAEAIGKLETECKSAAKDLKGGAPQLVDAMRQASLRHPSLKAVFE